LYTTRSSDFSFEFPDLFNHSKYKAFGSSHGVPTPGIAFAVLSAYDSPHVAQLMQSRALWLAGFVILLGTSGAHGDLLRPLGQIPPVKEEIRHLPSFPESPLLGLGHRLEGWVADSLSLADQWRGNVELKLRGVLDAHKLDLRSPCNVFLAKALKLLFGIADFELPGLPHGFLAANDIARYVAAHPDQWTLLGSASSQLALDRAQTYANLNTPVIAVYVSDPHGHVAVVLPGTLEYSGQWNLHVPNSASGFLDRPHKSYVGLRLSNAFQASDLPKVKLYTRNVSS
jgi:hypothetical protein